MNFHSTPPTTGGKDAAEQPARLFSRSKSVLSRGLTDQQEALLLDFSVERFNNLHGSLGAWRRRMGRFERQADGNYDDRRIPDPSITNAPESIFARQNFTLGMTAGFADFVYAQASDDIFGTRPWLAATPEGVSKIKLADVITKNAQWKLNQSNIEPVLLDSIRQACDLGTVFVKGRWWEDIEEFETMETCAHVDGKPLLDQTGDYIHDEGGLPDGIDPSKVEWTDLLVKNVQTVYQNVETSCLDWRNVAFDETAPELDLRYTDFYHAFELGVHDVCNHYELPDQCRAELLTLVDMEGLQTSRDHRQESNVGMTDTYRNETLANPKIKLVEGFVRCAPFGDGRTVRVNVVFSPTLRILFFCEYLANVTPKGMLPVFPVRCFKTTGRILGKGYFEKYEDANNAVDDQYNAVTYRNRISAQVFKGVHRDQFEDDLEAEDITFDPDKVYDIKPDGSLAKGIEFLVIPNNDSMSINLMNMMTQLMQMTSGITSASQGELKGAPESNTATGVNQIISRGAILIKVPISQMKGDIEKAVSFAVHLHYANHDHDENFTWGEGKDAELLEVLAADVKDMDAIVTLTMTQSQNQNKLQESQAGIAIGTEYAQLPETEKTSQRRLYIQALTALGFNDADRIIREAAVTPEGILALLPPDMQAQFAAFIQQQGGVMPPGGPAGAPAPPDASEPAPPPPSDPVVPPVAPPDTATPSPAP